MTSAWTTDHVLHIAGQQCAGVPLTTEIEARPVLPGIMLWDMQTDGLLGRIKNRTAMLAGNYFDRDPEQIIVAPVLDDLSGIASAFALAGRTIDDQD